MLHQNMITDTIIGNLDYRCLFCGTHSPAPARVPRYHVSEQ